MKITCPALADGAITSHDGRAYRVRNHVAFVDSDDWRHMQELTVTVRKDHPFNPGQKLPPVTIRPEVLDMDAAPIYADDPDDAGDFTRPGGGDAAELAKPATLLDLARGMSVAERSELAALLTAGDKPAKTKAA